MSWQQLLLPQILCLLCVWVLASVVVCLSLCLVIISLSKDSWVSESRNQDWDGKKNSFARHLFSFTCDVKYVLAATKKASLSLVVSCCFPSAHGKVVFVCVFLGHREHIDILSYTDKCDLVPKKVNFRQFWGCTCLLNFPLTELFVLLKPVASLVSTLNRCPQSKHSISL